MLTWRAGPTGELTWHAGPLHGCDVTLRPRGKAAGGPHEAQVAHKAQTWPESTQSTRVHADAREGRHVAKGMAVGGPTG